MILCCEIELVVKWTVVYLSDNYFTCDYQYFQNCDTLEQYAKIMLESRFAHLRPVL